ncbi:MAG: IS200/IS605 family transposase [Bacteroidales bacterium]|jgi:REP element-mobilizing transposase RayT|nr:IS200/IS605 family transposase [Bacteroidales bacterium]
MKPGTFTQMYVQLVFAVKNRDAELKKDFRGRVFEYMSGIITNLKHKSIIINGTSNHVHILLGLNPSVSISDTVHDIKRSSSLFINNEKLCPCRFSWQEGYGGFTYSRSQIEDVYNYIENQESHHKERTFREEYIDTLTKNEIEFNQQFLFDFWDDCL